MANISGIYTALSGMNAQRRVLDVTAHNIANQTTKGYHRQRAELAPIGLGAISGVFSGTNVRVGGVQVTGVSRISDQFAEARAMRETAIYGGTQTMRTALDRIEEAFPEPTDDGLAAKLDAYFSAWSDLASQPGDLAVRNQLLDSAADLVDTLGRASHDLDTIEEGAALQITTLSVEVNDLATRIADFNSSIVGSTGAANDLMDQRDVLVVRLAELTGAVARPAAGGAVDVTINGRAIVSGPLTDLVDGSTGALRWANDSSPINTPPSVIASLSAVINDVVPRYRNALDQVAATLVTDVNALHSTGYDLSGTTGWNFFDPANLTAASISLSADVLGQPERIAAGAPVLPGPVAPGPFDSEQARAISLIADAATGPAALYQSMVGTLGIETRSATQRDTVQSRISLSANADVESVAGVSLDEEMATLVAAQRAYEASARVMTAVDEMLQVLMRTGVVGR